MVDQEISQHRAAEGSDERCHHRVSQGRAPLSQNRKCERFWTLPPVVSCFFGRIAPSDASTESCFSIRGNRENEIASFRASDTETLQSQVNKAGKKTTLAQWVTSFSRATNKPSTSYDDRAASGQSKQAAHARSAKVKPLHATLARRAVLRLDFMAAPDPQLMGVPRPQFPRLCPACLPRYPLQTILRQVLRTPFYVS